MKLLLGGSPCTHWSIAQTRNRETKPEGLGWELFRNYLIAKEKFQPAYFLYENNKSMAPAIREQITKELGVEPILINSALVSAQSRQRLYWTNIPGVEQPEDLGLVLRDILESGVCWQEKGYSLTEPVNITVDGKAQCLRATYYKDGIRNMVGNSIDRKTCAAEPVYPDSPEVLNVNPCGHGMNGAVIHVNGKSRTLTTNKGEGPKIIVPVPMSPIRIGSIECGGDSNGQGCRVYSPDGKSKTLCGNGGGAGAKTGLYTVPTPCCVAQRGRYAKEDGGTEQHLEPRHDGKTNTLTTVQKDNLVLMPLVNYCPPEDSDVKITDHNIRCARQDGSGTVQGYTVYFEDAKSPAVIAGQAHKMKIIELATGKEWPIYEVKDGLIAIKGAQYPIKLADGYYIIRKLTVRECMRLQTVPEDYVFPVSDSQAYKMLGNGWTVDVIAHILSYCPDITTEPLTVLSMYDGMSCGRLALDKLGAHISRYYATEIDKYAIKTTQANFPDTIQLGDAFGVREEDWWSFLD